MAWFLAVSGVLLLIIPIGYSFLLLFGKIEIKDRNDAFVLGYSLWIVCGFGCILFIAQALDLIGHMAK